MEYVLLIIGLAAGAGLGVLFIKQKYTRIQTQLEADLKHVQESLENAQSEVSEFEAQLKTEKDRATELDSSLTELNIKLPIEEGKVKEKDDELSKIKDDYQQKTDDYNALSAKYAEVKAQKDALDQKIEEQEKHFEERSEQMKETFANVANEILDKKSETFDKKSKESLDVLLKPLGVNLKDFKDRVDKVYNEEARERFSLEKEIKRLAELNQDVSQNAKNLTTALQTNTKKQGNWGEMILENILEASGLRKDQDFVLENYLKDEQGNYMLNDQGKKMRPDAIVSFPDNRKVIIDSKVSLNAFVEYVNETDETKRKVHLKNHLDSVKKHVTELSNKQYDKFDKSLDFVLMFIPIEPAFATVLGEETSLWNFAYQKRVVIISPSNLIATLKLASELWKREEQSRNANEIAKRGTMLFEKFSGFVKNMEKIGTKLNDAQGAYTDAYRQLTVGPGNLVRQSLQLKEMVKSDKELPAKTLAAVEEDQSLIEEK